MKALDFIGQCTIDGFNLIFPDYQLPRETYTEVKKLLEGIGGKWNKSVNGFIFKANPLDYLGKILDGEKLNLQKQYQFFETPESLVDHMVSFVPLDNPSIFSMLEPSAGRGAILRGVWKVAPTQHIYVCEAMPQNVEYLKTLPNVTFLGEDFLTTEFSHKYDLILANPPFTKNQDIQHCYRMYDLLANGGTMVVILSTHWKHTNGKIETKFREWLSEVAYLEDIPRGTFEDTTVPTILAVIKKSEASEPKFEKSQSKIQDNKRPAVVGSLNISDGYVEKNKISSKLYGFTTAAGPIQQALNGYLGCQDGSDYTLTKSEMNEVTTYIQENYIIYPGFNGTSMWDDLSIGGSYVEKRSIPIENGTLQSASGSVKQALNGYIPCQKGFYKLTKQELQQLKDYLSK